MLGRTNSANSELKDDDLEVESENQALETAGGKRKAKRGKSDSDETITSDSKPDDAETTANADESDTDNSELEQALAAEKDKYLRLAAEYDNFRKRSIKERETTYSDARADAITRLLPVYDNLERALKMDCEDEAFYKGIEMTMTGLTEILEGMNVKRIQAVGEPFDPNRHNAVMTIENPDLGEKIVAEEYQKGFVLGDRVIRFSTVVVAN